MKKLLVFMKDYKLEAILGPFFKLLEASFELTVPLVVASIIKVGIASADYNYIIRKSLLLIALGLLGLVCSITAQYFSAKAAIGFSSKIRHALFSKIQSFSFSTLDKIGNSTLMTRMTSDINQIQTGVNMTLRLFLRSPFIVFGAMIMAFTIDVKAALTFAVAIPILLVIVFGILLITIPLYKKTQNKLDRIMSVSRENLTGVRDIRAFCKEDSEIIGFNQDNDSLNKSQKFVGNISALMNPLTYAIVNIAILILIMTCGKRVNSGYIEQGDLVALYNYMSQILIELIKLANLIVTITKSIACAKRVSAVLEINEPDDNLSDEASEKSDKFIEFKNVTLKYKNAGDASLSDINFSVKRGETIGIIGGTGSGKTSLVSLLPHFYDSTSGDVFIDGKNVKCYSNDKLRHMVKIVMQKSILFKGTIRSNMQFSDKFATDDEIWSALKAAQADSFVKEKGGLDAPVNQFGRNFSGGQKQRLTIARSLVGNPDIIIFDDSTSALDYATDAALRKAIRNLPNNPTVFIVSQRAASLLNADKIIVLDEGSVVGIGNHSELISSCDVYKEIYYSQYPKEEV